MTDHAVQTRPGDRVIVDALPALVVPPVDPPPIGGNAYQAKTTAELYALLTRKDLGVLPVIVIPKGVVLPPLEFKPTHGGTSITNRTTVRAEVDGQSFVDCGGGNSGTRWNGGRWMDLEGLAYRNGDFTQNAIVTYSWTSNGVGQAPGTKGVACRRLSHDATCKGPARASTGTSNASAHFFYLSAAKAGETHDDITIEDCVGHADDKGLAAMLHLYSGPTPINRFIARRNTAYGYTQAVMGYAGGLVDGLIEDFTGIDCYTVLRLKYGTGRVVRPKSSHPGTAPKANPVYEKAAGWFIDDVSGMH